MTLQMTPSHLLAFLPLQALEKDLKLDSVLRAAKDVVP